MNNLAGLVALRTKSMRRGIWYRVLNRLERAQVDWTVRIVKTVRSPLLAKVLNSIMDKLSAALENEVSKRIRSVGRALARKLSAIAGRWGNALAETWAQDEGFARFLAIMDMNSFRSTRLRQHD